MMNAVVEEALRLVNVAAELYEEGNSMSYFALLNGIGKLRFEPAPGSGHNYVALIDAVHIYHSRFPQMKTDQNIYQTLIKCAQYSYYSAIIATNTINIIAYELEKEKKGSNSFSVDCNSILSLLKSSIEKYKTDFEKNVDKNSRQAFDQWLTERSAFLKNNFNVLFWN